MPPRRLVLLMVVSGLLALPQGLLAETGEPSYSRLASPRNLYWGDTHLHSNLSLDANGLGNKVLTPDDAYRFARGDTVTGHNGMQARLHRPLDFLVIADHAENLGVMAYLEGGNADLADSRTGREWHAKMQASPMDIAGSLASPSLDALVGIIRSVAYGQNGERAYFWAADKDIPEGFGRLGSKAFLRSVWEQVGNRADRYNEPGVFTAFVGYEWSSADGRDGRRGNLHRIVVFRDGAELTNTWLPFSAIDSANPEDLWANLARYVDSTGGDVLAIPHNSNLSNGEMFSQYYWDGQPIDRAYASTRSQWEPLVEVTQIKGDSESHPILSPTDEFADFETWNSWAGPTYEGIRTEGWIDRKAAEYARAALKLGLDLQVRLGVNPFQFGMIGSTDAHTSLSAVEEDNFWGKFSLAEPSRNRLPSLLNSGLAWWNKYRFAAAAGYTAVWAETNTREALFEAMRRKEVYASTGPRIAVRFFGGWTFEPDDALRPNLPKVGYARGVPMGGQLPRPPDGRAPSFLIQALKDPEGANLDRVQLIKGWRSKDGVLHEQIHNVALSDGRRDQGPATKPVGSTVDVDRATYLNSIGDPVLAVVWQDPDFDAAEPSFYYLRILEIPTPRWTAYDAAFFGLTSLPADLPAVLQERAYTSPIWYTP